MAPQSPVNREPLFRAHGRAIQQLGGRFITGEDVGTSPSDMEYVFRETRYVAGLPRRSGDPSPSTVRGALCAIRGAACATRANGK
jgi:leucine dehydrogenase